MRYGVVYENAELLKELSIFPFEKAKIEDIEIDKKVTVTVENTSIVPYPVTVVLKVNDKKVEKKDYTPLLPNSKKTYEIEFPEEVNGTVSRITIEVHDTILYMANMNSKITSVDVYLPTVYQREMGDIWASDYIYWFDMSTYSWRKQYFFIPIGLYAILEVYLPSDTYSKINNGTVKKIVVTAKSKLSTSSKAFGDHSKDLPDVTVTFTKEYTEVSSCTGSYKYDSLIDKVFIYYEVHGNYGYYSREYNAKTVVYVVDNNKANIICVEDLSYDYFGRCATKIIDRRYNFVIISCSSYEMQRVTLQTALYVSDNIVSDMKILRKVLCPSGCVRWSSF